MQKLERIRAKIEKIETLCIELRADLDALQTDDSARGTGKAVRQNAVPPTKEESQIEFERLYKEYLAGNSASVSRFVDQHTKDYLKAFCKANSLPVDIKNTPKQQLGDLILQWLAQRKAITGSRFVR